MCVCVCVHCLHTHTQTHTSCVSVPLLMQRGQIIARSLLLSEVQKHRNTGLSTQALDSRGKKSREEPRQFPSEFARGEERSARWTKLQTSYVMVYNILWLLCSQESYVSCVGQKLCCSGKFGFTKQEFVRIQTNSERSYMSNKSFSGNVTSLLSIRGPILRLHY